MAAKIRLEQLYLQETREHRLIVYQNSFCWVSSASCLTLLSLSSKLDWKFIHFLNYGILLVLYNEKFCYDVPFLAYFRKVELKNQKFIDYLHYFLKGSNFPFTFFKANFYIPFWNLLSNINWFNFFRNIFLYKYNLALSVRPRILWL